MTMKQKRTHRHKKKIYRETWAMDEYFIGWLEERLPVFLKEGGRIVDFTYHKFEYQGKEYTQQEMIEKMMAVITEIRGKESHEDTSALKQEVAKMWAIVMPAMWW